MFEGDLVVDLTNIPLAFGPVEFEIKFLPCKLILATSRVVKWSTMQVAQVLVLTIFLTLSSPPHSILISGRVSSQLVRILRIHFFVYLNFSLPFSASVPVFYDSYLFEEDWLLAWKLLFLTLIAYKQTSTSAGDDLQFVFNLCEPSHKWGQSLSYTSVSSLPFFNKGWELNLHPLNWPAAHVEK